MKMIDQFLKKIHAFDSFGRKTVIYERNGIKYFINQFWTNRQRRSNSIHEISYRACFKPELPRFFIENLSRIGDVVYDPFMGRGTTLIEAELLNRKHIGNDISPLSIAFAEPRLFCPSISDVSRRLDEIKFDSFTGYEEKDLLVFFHPNVLSKIEGIRKLFLEKKENNELDYTDKWIRMIILNRLTGHSSGFLSVKTFPPNITISIDRQRKINEKYNRVPDDKDFKQIIIRKTKRLLRDGRINCKNIFILNNHAHNTPEISEDSVDLIITSPPFLDVVDYKNDNWLKYWFLGIEESSLNITQHRSIHSWKEFMTDVMRELVRVTKHKGIIAIEVGEVRSGNVFLEDEIIECADIEKLRPICVLINNCNFTKTSHCWNVSNNLKGTNTNRIVLFEVIKK